MHTHTHLSRAAFIRMAHLIGFGALCIAGSFLVGVRSAGDTRAMLTQSVQAGDELVKFPYGQLPSGVSQTDLDTDHALGARAAAILITQITR